MAIDQRLQTLPQYVIKRDGTKAEFDLDKVQLALTKCYTSLGLNQNLDVIGHIADVVAVRYHDSTPTVEQIQDIVEAVLVSYNEYEPAKHYILYRAEHEKQRTDRPIPATVEAAFSESAEYFPTALQQFQFFDKYSRWDHTTGHRETWLETVGRAVSFLRELSDDVVYLDVDIYTEIQQAILHMEAMPSMRLLAMAGEAARRQNISVYNCSYLPICDVDAFVEGLIISMAGCGVGYSVENRYVERFPRVVRQKSGERVKAARISGETIRTYVVEDSSEGWAEALRLGLHTWMSGEDIGFDYRELRPAGAILKTKGGRSSGPDALKQLMAYARAKILSRQGTFLRPIDAHDLMCAVGGAAVAGGVRRTAMISLFDPDDDEMRLCKSGANLNGNDQRWNANNSMVLDEEERPISQAEFAHWFLDMVDSQRGEPGIFSRSAARATVPARRANWEFGTNPCGEITLRPYEFCNLTIAVAREGDTFDDLARKVKIASWIGTIQSCATSFPGLRSEWSQNCQEERLLGVSIAGQMDCEAAQDPHVQAKLKQIAVEANRSLAMVLGINPSAAVTCVKPDGNSSVLLNASSGLHTRWSAYQIRNVRVAATSPVLKVLREHGVPLQPENGQALDSATTWVASFPVKAPVGAKLRGTMSAIEQCRYWLQVKQQWTEHNPSVTIYYDESEVLELMNWVYEHRHWLGGMSFLPAGDALYDQMPNIEIDHEEYQILEDQFPAINWSKLYRYEEADMTTAAQEIACVAGQCELV